MICRGILAAAVTVVSAGLFGRPAPAPASGLGYAVGISEQGSRFLADPLFTGLRVDDVRVVVPWDVLVRADGQATDRLDAAAASGKRVLVALDHSRGVDCREQRPCPAPSPAELGAAFAALHERYPAVSAWTPWNEPNHAAQPTFRHPELAADYYDAAREACASCLLVAGDVLDDADERRYLTAYLAALGEAPAVVGIHNYFDATYFRSDGVDAALATTDAELWLTEVGGIVRFSPAGRAGLPYDESRAADAVRWSLGLPLSHPRIARVYLYQWQSAASEEFDAGLLNQDGTARPGYSALAGTVGLRPDAPAPVRAADRKSVV